MNEGAGPFRLERPSDDSVVIHLSHCWRVGEALPSGDDVIVSLSDTPGLRQVAFDTTCLDDWDSKLLTFLIGLKDWCAANEVSYVSDGLPHGAKRLITLALAVPARKEALQDAGEEPFLEHVGNEGMGFFSSISETVDFLGSIGIAFARLLGGKAAFRRQDFWQFLFDSGVQALPIVSLISVLVSLILAFVGAIQLQAFGAQLYVADLVGIAMVRVVGAIVTGIIMAGRTGAAYAAQLGTMQVNEEIDALHTLGVSPVEFLVLPRMLALAIMMPLLCIYANVMGVLGGLIVAVTMLDINPMQYLVETKQALALSNVWIGISRARSSASSWPCPGV